MVPENMRWYAMSAEEVAEYFSTDLEAGIDENEAKARLSALGENEIFRIPHSTLSEHLLSLTANPLSVLLVIVSVLGALLGDYALLIVAVLLLGSTYAMGIMTYVKSNRVLEMMGEISIPFVTVIREGRAVTITSQALVPGDIMLVRSGQIMPCDARLIEDERLVVIEQGITEATGMVSKNAEQYDARVKKPHECVNMLYASTVIYSGRGRAIVTETGKNTLVGRTKKSAIAFTYERLELFKKLKGISHGLTLGGIAMCTLLTLLALVFPAATGALESLCLCLAAASALICECYTVFGYLTVALGVYGTLDTKKQVNTGTLIRNVENLDKLRDITVLALPSESLCSDKNIKLDRVCLYDRVIDVDNGDEIPEMAERLLVKAIISTGKYTASRLVTANNRRAGSYTDEENAIIECGTSRGLYSVELDSTYPIVGHASAEDAPFETTLVKWNGENCIMLRGDISAVLERCTYYKSPDSNALLPMTPLSRRTIATVALQMMRQSHRVTAIASGVSRYNSLVRVSSLYRDLTFEGMIAFNEPVLPGAAYNIAKCREAGIKVMLFTKDISDKNVHFARSLGIVRDGRDKVISAEEYSSSEENYFVTDLSKYRLFQGFKVSQRRKILRLLRDRGERVAYYGKHTNETLLFREAQIGVTDALTLSPKSAVKSMSTDGDQSFATSAGTYKDTTADAMRFSADVIVSPISEDGKGGFNALVGALCTAKGIYFKIKRILSYLISTALARLVFLVISLFTPSLQLISPVSALIWGVGFDFLIALAIIFSEDPGDILRYKDKYSRIFLGRAELICALINGGVLALSVSLSCLICRNLLGMNSSAETVTLALVSALICSLVIFFEGRFKGSVFGAPLSLGSVLLFAVLLYGALVALAMLIPAFGSFLGLSGIAPLAFVGAFVTGAVTLSASELSKLVLRALKR